MSPRTMFDKIWDSHVVAEGPGERSLLYIDRTLLHEVHAFTMRRMARDGRSVRRPELVFSTADHYVGTTPGRPVDDPGIGEMVTAIADESRSRRIRAFTLGDAERGIVHVIGPEQGLTIPGIVLVCGDSHTATHGALGAVAFGIGSNEVEHVLATSTLWQRRPRQLRITVDNELGHGVTAKDLILTVIREIGIDGGIGHAVEYAGPAIRAMTVEQRLTVCNMSIEAGAKIGMIAPDQTTIDYVAGRPFAPTGADWEQAVAAWRELPTDDGARFDREVALDAAEIEPSVTWGITPAQSVPIGGRVPAPDPSAAEDVRAQHEHALAYMGLAPGTPLTSVEIDRVFIGSCTNARLDDLREAAEIARGRKARVPAWVVPGSGPVKAAAEREGLDRVFRDAGFEWRESGCSMCVGTNGEIGVPGQRIASTSNRNFEGRQGRDVRTHLLSPAMAAAAAVTGRLTDVRTMGE
jgi:3-isopropylmalate/(R)-2-methylmalate dehydratase large subunit